MPIYIGNATVNTAITSTSVTENTPQGFAEYNATRNSIMPALRLDFVNSNALDPRITFTRASSATYFNNAGVLSTAPINAPRFDYNPATGLCNGLLMEQSSTNLLLQSNFQSGWSGGATAGTLTANQLLSPDGTVDAAQYVESTLASAFHYKLQSVTKAASALVYTFSVFLKASGNRQVGLRMQDTGGTNGAVVTCDPVAGTIGTSAVYGTFTSSSATIQTIGNGWYRFSLTATSSTDTLITAQLETFNAGTNVYTGDGVSGFYCFGAQLEQIAFITSYIPTTASTASRSEDSAIANTFSLYNSPNATGTILSEFMFTTTPVTGGHHVWAMMVDTTGANAVDIYHQVGQNFVYPIFTVAGVSTSWYNTSLNNFTVNVPSKHAFAWNVSAPTEKQAFNGSYSGQAAFSISNTANYQLLYIGSSFFGGSALYGYVRKFAYYPVYLSNNELISLTS